MDSLLTQTPAEVLTRAADALATGEITWGGNYYVDPIGGARCALGAIAWAVDPENEDGDPRFVREDVRPLARLTVESLADYLATEGLSDARCQCGCGAKDPVDTVGGFNDEQTTPEPVIAALRAAAGRAA